MYTIAMDSGGQTRVGASQELGLGIRDGSLRGGLSSDRIRLSERWKDIRKDSRTAGCSPCSERCEGTCRS
jgi:hypothetical protein